MADNIEITKLENPAKPAIHLPITKDQAKGMAIGDRVKVTIEGEIEGIHKDFTGDQFGLDIRVESESKIESNFADKSLKEMSGVEVMNEADRGYEELLEG